MLHFSRAAPASTIAANAQYSLQRAASACYALSFFFFFFFFFFFLVSSLVTPFALGFLA